MPQTDYLNARIEALERENRRLTQLIEQREKNVRGFLTDINDPVFDKPLNHFSDRT